MLPHLATLLLLNKKIRSGWVAALIHGEVLSLTATSYAKSYGHSPETCPFGNRNGGVGWGMGTERRSGEGVGGEEEGDVAAGMLNT